MIIPDNVGFRYDAITVKSHKSSTIEHGITGLHVYVESNAFPLCLSFTYGSQYLVRMDRDEEPPRVLA